MLIPLVADRLRGRKGAVWTTDVVAFNGGQEETRFLPNGRFLTTDPERLSTIPSGRATLIYVPTGSLGNERPAILLHISEAQAGHVAFATVLREVSGLYDVPPVHIPAVAVADAPGPIRITITAKDSERPMWALLSVTDDVTQHVEIVTPAVTP